MLREWTEVDGRMEGPLKAWYAEGKLRLEEEYKAGKRDGVHSVMECEDNLLAVNGKTGLIASSESWFEGELDLTVHRFFPNEDAGGYFEPVFFFTLTDLPTVMGMHWVGENSLLLVMEKSCIRMDIDPESFEGENREIL